MSRSFFITLFFEMHLFALEILMFCAVILVLLLAHDKRSIDGVAVQVLFRRILWCALFSVLFYALTFVFDFEVLKPYVMASRISNAAYFVLTLMLPSMWLKYTLMSMGSFKRDWFIPRIVMQIPIVILIACSIASIWTGWIFYVDEKNVYFRGPLYISFIMTIGFYILFSSFIAFRRSFLKEFHAERSRNLSLASFALFTVAGLVVETLHESCPASAMGTVLTLMVNYLSCLSLQISTDSLTKLNNRNQLNHYLSNALAELAAYEKLFLFVLDMDSFKQINDNYGHLEGDRALLTFSGVLKRVCGPKGLFISRFGGDEFVLVGKFEHERKCASLVKEIREALDEASKGFVCHLSVSVGVCPSQGRRG